MFIDYGRSRFRQLPVVIVVDGFSSFMWPIAMQGRLTSANVGRNFEQLMQRIRRQPATVQADSGGEYTGLRPTHKKLLYTKTVVF